MRNIQGQQEYKLNIEINFKFSTYFLQILIDSKLIYYPLIISNLKKKNKNISVV